MKGKKLVQKTTPRIQGLMLLPVERISPAKIRDKIEASRTSPRSLARTTIRKNIIPLIALNLPKQ